MRLRGKYWRRTDGIVHALTQFVAASKGKIDLVGVCGGHDYARCKEGEDVVAAIQMATTRAVVGARVGVGAWGRI